MIRSNCKIFNEAEKNILGNEQKFLTKSGFFGIMDNAIKNDADGDERITVNGTPVKMEIGKLQGEIGEKIMGNSESTQEVRVVGPCKVAVQQQKTILGALKGTKTHDGVTVKSIDGHAIDRMVERGYASSHLKNVIENSKPRPGNKPDRNIYEKGRMRVVVNCKTGHIVTVVRL